MKKQHYVYGLGESEIGYSRSIHSQPNYYLPIYSKQLDAELFSLHGEELGVFTTFRAEMRHYDQDTACSQEAFVLQPEYHLNRLLDSARELKIVEDSSPLHTAALIRSELKRVLTSPESASPPFSELRVRLLIRSEDSFEIFFAPFYSTWEEKEAIEAVTVNASRPLPEHKTTDVSVSENARVLASEAGADEALLIDPEGNISEGAWSNFFWFDSAGVLRTANRNVLPGIIRRVLLEEHPCTPGEYKLKEVLQGAAEAFFTNSASGIMPLRSLNAQPFPEGAPGPQTAELQRWLRSYTESSAEAL